MQWSLLAAFVSGYVFGTVMTKWRAERRMFRLGVRPYSGYDLSEVRAYAKGMSDAFVSSKEALAEYMRRVDRASNDTRTE